ncbi:2556_t:CDS:1 [Ambispora gerdemannii]|uniref:2556_t:CDS:1 n=1 Tax=Ambispora gerdemannii TaxID=144530 RepID=A0A9N9G6I6_9GLOM|nr:2556_t:CDS:1 [Ambispora gerdemannii]
MKALLNIIYLVKRLIDDGYGNTTIFDVCYIPRSHPRNDPLGCYVRNVNSAETFNGLASLGFADPQRAKNLMDPGFCVNYCGNYLFKYAALGKGKDCRCGKDNSLAAYTELNDTECNITCVGSKTDMCGGEEAYTVYDTSELPSYKVPKITINEKLDIIHNLENNPQYKGCIADSPFCNRRTLNAASETFTNMTVDKCIDFCKKGGFNYTGLEMGTECYCGNTYDPTNLKTEECSTSCPGNNSQMCGGPLALSVYEVPPLTSAHSVTPASVLGLSVGLVAGFLLICLGIWFYLRRRPKKQSDFSDESCSSNISSDDDKINT